VAAVLVGGWGLLQAGAKAQESSQLATPYSLLPTLYSLLPTPYSLLSTLVVLGATIWLLTRAHTLPPTDLRDAVEKLNARTTAADAVITARPKEAAAFAELYKGHADVWGLNAGGPPLDPDTAAALAQVTESHPHVWWLPNGVPPGQSGVELWLMNHGFRAENDSFGRRRLALYYFPPQPLTEVGIGVTFGEVIALERVETLTAVRPGDVLPLVLHWRAVGAVSDDYRVFVHLLDADGNRVAQSDGVPALWTRPTSGWSPGESIEDRRGLSLPADLPSGNYTLVAGLYRPLDGVRLLTGEGADHASLTTVRVWRRVRQRMQRIGSG